MTKPSSVVHGRLICLRLGSKSDRESFADLSVTLFSEPSFKRPDGARQAIDTKMNLSFSRNAFFAATALLLTCSTIWAGPADDLIKKGDDFDLKLQASEALNF